MLSDDCVLMDRRLLVASLPWYLRLKLRLRLRLK